VKSHLPIPLTAVCHCGKCSKLSNLDQAGWVSFDVTPQSPFEHSVNSYHGTSPVLLRSFLKNGIVSIDPSPCARHTSIDRAFTRAQGYRDKRDLDVVQGISSCFGVFFSTPSLTYASMFSPPLPYLYHGNEFSIQLVVRVKSKRLLRMQRSTLFSNDKEKVIDGIPLENIEYISKPKDSEISGFLVRIGAKPSPIPLPLVSPAPVALEPSRSPNPLLIPTVFTSGKHFFELNPGDCTNDHIYIGLEDFHGQEDPSSMVFAVCPIGSSWAKYDMGREMEEFQHLFSPASSLLGVFIDMENRNVSYYRGNVWIFSGVIPHHVASVRLFVFRHYSWQKGEGEGEWARGEQSAVSLPFLVPILPPPNVSM
jgi:hypothetical protein